MSVAGIGTSVPRVTQSGGTPGTTNQGKTSADARPNTGQTAYNSLFRHMQNSPQKLPVSRIPGINNRMQRETKSSSAKRSRWYKSESYIDPRTYSWKNLSLFSDYQAHMWTPEGGIKAGYKK